MVQPKNMLLVSFSLRFLSNKPCHLYMTGSGWTRLSVLLLDAGTACLSTSEAVACVLLWSHPQTDLWKQIQRAESSPHSFWLLCWQQHTHGGTPPKKKKSKNLRFVCLARVVSQHKGTSPPDERATSQSACIVGWLGCCCTAPDRNEMTCKFRCLTALVCIH